MITLSVINLKSKETKIETFISKDKAEERVSAILSSPKKWKVDGVSYETKAEKGILAPFLPKEEE